jgi:hypothetical protein
MSKPLIEPAEMFSMNVMMEGETLLRDDPTRVTDNHLAHFAVYDRHFASRARETRDKAIEKAFAKAMAPPPPVRAAATPASLPAPGGFRDTDTFDSWSKRNEMCATPIGFVHDLSGFSIKRFVQLQGEIKELRGENTALKAEIAEMRAEITELKARPTGLEWGGNFDETKRYKVGQIVRRKGLWLALADSQGQRPGSSPAWLLALKQGEGI